MGDNSSSHATEDEVKKNSRNVAYYFPELDDLPEPARHLLEVYSGIPPDQVKDHVIATREKAFDIFPYPCIGGWRFLDLNLRRTAPYASIVSRLKEGQKLLDLGCCFGQELRQLILDGVPQENLYGMDLREEFFDLGYDLFQDREKCKVKFLAGDVFDPKPKAEIEALDGKMDVVYAGAFFHLFDEPEQTAVAKRIVKFLSAKPGSMVLGRHVGNEKPGRYEHMADQGDGFMYRHNEESWKKLWDEVGKGTGSEWETSAELRPSEWHTKFGGKSADGAGMMHFVVTRK